ncbi:MAG: F0F1 ATP synthase subunit A, partial [Opitutales bacterium]|nr:F0F1 ATP synthase subunit A [Opitutales bacterium]
KKILATLSAPFLASGAFASESVKPSVMFEFCGLPFTNSMLTAAAFSVLLFLILRFVFLRGGAKLVPGRGQVFIEGLVDAFGGIFEGVMGRRAYRGAAPFLLCLFTFILAMNWSGLLPGVGSVGEVSSVQVSANAPASEIEALESRGFEKRGALEGGGAVYEKFAPFIRPANSDMNTTMALALLSFILFFYYVKKYAGFGALYHEWFGNKADRREIPAIIYYMLFPVFFAVGFIEVISACVRPISLSFRLFGNVFGGETLLHQMHQMAWQGGAMQLASWLLPLPFYFLELLVGAVQAFVFTLLTALYIGLITASEENEAEG